MNRRLTPSIWILVCGFGLAVLLAFSGSYATLSFGQTLQQPPPPPPQQVYWLPARGPLLTPGNFIRRVWGAPQVLSPYVAYGPAYEVQPVAPYYQSPFRRAW